MQPKVNLIRKFSLRGMFSLYIALFQIAMCCVCFVRAVEFMGIPYDHPINIFQRQFVDGRRLLKTNYFVDANSFEYFALRSAQILMIGSYCIRQEGNKTRKS